MDSVLKLHPAALPISRIGVATVHDEDTNLDTLFQRAERLERQISELPSHMVFPVKPGANQRPAESSWCRAGQKAEKARRAN